MNKFILLLLAGLVFSSCGSRLVYFTEPLRQRENWSEPDLRNIQFYTSRDIVLSRSLGNEETVIESGRVIRKDGRRIERVVIPARTPGVLVMMPEEKRLGISFEAEGREAFLMFGPQPRNGDRYALLAQEWTRQSGRVNYQGKTYHADPASAYASLLVDLRQVGSRDETVHRVRGRRIEQP